ncbi:MAG: pentapeptide repeat-containing protein [Oryzomonas sp.]|uniref:pentapeptide repeat-containing protein n=1 Tax=Oryzomonas sp. TaxID=2855186 RepID=UPI002842966E|nr:pentapeptide repeat-containing protein [Oryzomonas sp.]MDR3580813.1 pentapeptide repeat-containing protein [Oryzomonas sp.]
MTIFRVVLVAAGIFGAVSMADIPSSTVQAAEGAIGAGNAAIPAPADQVSQAPPKRVGAVVPRKRRKKKKSARVKTVRNATPEASESAPGTRLSSEEVIALLRANRDLSGKNLSGINLSGVNLSKCNLKGVDLSNANLERADLGESDLERANLAGANLRMASFKLSGMIGANLENAILDGAIWQDGRICAKGSLGVCREAAPHFFPK